MAGRKPQRCRAPLRHDQAYTGLDLVVWGAVALVVIVLLAYLVPGALGAAANPGGGIIPGAIRQTGEQINVVGSIMGFPAVLSSPEGIPVRWPVTNPGRLGGVGMTVSLFIGSTGGIDMACTTVFWTDASKTQALRISDGRPLLCPNWTIAAKRNRIPLRSADEDDILEPGEQFDLIVCTGTTYAPYDTFTIAVDPAGPGPVYPVKCTVPFPITRTMEL